MAVSYPSAWPLLVATSIGYHCWLTSSTLERVRYQLFTNDFFEKNFPELPEFDRNSGFPDSGNGRYSQKLAFEDWHRLNCAARIFQSYVESVYVPILATIVGGIKFPKLACSLGLIFIVGREIYRFGYNHRGPRGRRVGAVITDTAVVVMAGCALYSCWSAGGGYKGFISFIKN